MLSDESSPDAVEAGTGAPGDRESSHFVLLLITVVLVVAGLVLLVAGYVGSSMAILYASIGCAAVAGVILIVYSRLNRRRQVALAGVPAGETGSGTAGAVEVAGTAEAPGPAEVPRTAGALESAGAGVAEAPGPAGGAPSESTAAAPEPGLAGDQPGEKPGPG